MQGRIKNIQSANANAETELAALKGRLQETEKKHAASYATCNGIICNVKILHTRLIMISTGLLKCSCASRTPAKCGS